MTTLTTKILWTAFGLVVGLIIMILLLRNSIPQNETTSLPLEDVERNKVLSVAEEFIKNRIAKADTLNYKVFSDSILKINQASGFPNASSYAEYIQSILPLDFAEIVGVDLSDKDSAKVFVRDYGKDTTINIYNFTKETTGWKFNGYVFNYDDW